MLFYKLTASSLVLLLEGCFEITEFLVFGSERISEHIELALQLCDFFFIQLFESNHGIVNLLNFFVFGLD